MDIEQRVERLERERCVRSNEDAAEIRDEIRRDLAARTDPFRAQVERDAIVDGLRAQVAELRGAMAAQDQREAKAGERCGVSPIEYGCDWPDAVADEVLSLRAQLRQAEAAVDALTKRSDAAVKRAEEAERAYQASNDEKIRQDMQIDGLSADLTATRTRLAECERVLGMWRDRYAMDRNATWSPLTATRAYFASAPAPEPDGAQMIAAERRRQVDTEGYTVSHDAEHGERELVEAAISYAKAQDENAFAGGMWPWERSAWKPKDRLRNLVRAGALIAAGIDRLRAPAPEPEPDEVATLRAEVSRLAALVERARPTVAEERAATVAFLRAQPIFRSNGPAMADRIERGEHRR